MGTGDLAVKRAEVTVSNGQLLLIELPVPIPAETDLNLFEDYQY